MSIQQPSLTPQSNLWNRHFIAVCMSSFFLFMPFYILIVTLPIYVMDTLQGRQDQIGLIMTSFVMTAIIFRPLAGKWLDEGNRKRVMMVGLGIFLICSLLYPIVPNYTMLLVLRLMHGVGFGIAATALGAIAADLVPMQRKGEGVGYFGLFMSLAMVIGPFVGLEVMGSLGESYVFIVCIVLAVLSVLCGLTVKPAPRVAHKHSIPAAEGWRKFIEPRAIVVALAASLIAFAYSGVTAYLSVYAKELNLTETSSYFFMVFALMIVLSRPFTGRLFDRMGPHILVYPGIVLYIIGLFILSRVDSPTTFLLAAAVLGLGYGALLPSFQTIAVKSSPTHRTGIATATYFLLFDAGFGVGSTVLGVVASSSGYSAMYQVAGAVVILTVPLYYFFSQRSGKRAKLKQAEQVKVG